VSGSEGIRDVLVPVYEALDLDWNPETLGSVEDEIGALGLGTVEEAILEVLGEHYELRAGELDQTTLELASSLEPAHRVET
jgi:hypothetical protein